MNFYKKIKRIITDIQNNINVIIRQRIKIIKKNKIKHKICISIKKIMQKKNF